MTLNNEKTLVMFEITKFKGPDLDYMLIDDGSQEFLCRMAREDFIHIGSIFLLCQEIEEMCCGKSF